MKVLKLSIAGKVQGVGYRRWFQQQAVALGLTGYVQNLASGEVEALVLGEEAILDELVNYAKVGPSHAMVSRLICTELALGVIEQQKFITFEIRR